MSEQIHVMVVDDERNYLLVLEALLADEGYKVTTLNDPRNRAAFSGRIRSGCWSSPTQCPNSRARKFWSTCLKHYPPVPVLIMTAFGSIEGAVEPFASAHYITSLPAMNCFWPCRTLPLVQSPPRLPEPSGRRGHPLRQGQIIGNSKKRPRRAGPHYLTPRPAKAPCSSPTVRHRQELVARAIRAPRRAESFITVDCMSTNPGVLEGRLFGLKRLVHRRRYSCGAAF